MQENIGQEKFGPVSPWWKHGLAWMVCSGPAIVAVASFITLGLIIIHPDPELHPAAQSAKQAPAEDDSGAHQPALPARNHAAERP